MNNAPVLNIKIESTKIKSTRCKLKANWTSELAQDLQMFHPKIALEIPVPWFPICENERDIYYTRNDEPFNGYGLIV